MFRGFSAGMAALWLWVLALALLSTPASAADRPARLRLVLVLDASGSMVANDPGKLVRVAAKMVSDLADERDHVTVMSFGSSVSTLAAEPGSSSDALRAAIDTLGRNESCTDYAMALEGAAAKLSGKPDKGERRVVLFLTDGRFEPVGERGPCGRFDTAPEAERRAIVERVERAAKRFSAAGARVFTIGLGAAPAQAQHSAALLRSVASLTGGRYVHAATPRDVPRIFASLFGALVGAPVMQLRLGPSEKSLAFEVPRGAERLHVVAVPDALKSLEGISLTRADQKVGFEPARVESGTQSGYRLARVSDDASGHYVLASGGPLEVLVVPDVGLSLRIEGVSELLPEGERLSGSVALRTRLGDPVKLAPEFLDHVSFTVALGDEKLFDQRPDAGGVARFASAAPLARGKYLLSASARHELGFLDVAAVERRFSVEPRFSLKLSVTPIRFDTMAEPGVVPLAAPAVVRVESPEKVPIDVTVELKLPERLARDVSVEPASVTFGPDRPRSVELTLRWKDHEALRGESVHHREPIALVARPDDARMLTGDSEWSVPVDGRLRAWTLRRYIEEYKWQLLGALLALLLVVYLVGRAVAQKFPPKARIHYVEVGQAFESDSLIRRYARHGAYRSARFKFPLGKKARPLVVFKSTGARFEVRPESASVTIVDDAVPEGDREKRGPFQGSWEQRYRLGDRYEVWLTRQ